MLDSNKILPIKKYHYNSAIIRLSITVSFNKTQKSVTIYFRGHGDIRLNTMDQIINLFKAIYFWIIS